MGQSSSQRSGFLIFFLLIFFLYLSGQKKRLFNRPVGFGVAKCLCPCFFCYAWWGQLADLWLRQWYPAVEQCCCIESIGGSGMAWQSERKLYLESGVFPLRIFCIFCIVFSFSFFQFPRYIHFSNFHCSFEARKLYRAMHPAPQQRS